MFGDRFSYIQYFYGVIICLSSGDLLRVPVLRKSDTDEVDFPLDEAETISSMLKGSSITFFIEFFT